MGRKNSRALRDTAGARHRPQTSLDSFGYRLDQRYPEADLFCARCGKMSAPTPEAAWNLARSIHALHGGEPARRVYSCTDDGLPPFHWTRRP